MSAPPKTKLQRAWQAAPLAMILLIISLAAATVFGIRSAVYWYHRPPLAEREIAVAAWMTPRYVARSWGVPPKVIADAIGAAHPPPDGPMSLSAIALERGVPTSQIIEDAQAAIADFKAKRDK